VPYARRIRDRGWGEPAKGAFMLYPIFALLQTVGDGPPVKVDILPRCQRSGDDEIVVCGNPDASERYRLKPLPERYVAREGLPKAEIALPGNTRAAMEAKSQGVGAGVVSQRVMLRIKAPF
jgi:hypothetical protein